MSIVHGSMGLIYFVHEWKPRFNESALLSDPEMLSAVTAINRQIIRLAPVLNSPTIKDAVRVSSDNKDVTVVVVMKRHKRTTYLFAVGMRNGQTNATFTVHGLAGGKTVEVLGELSPSEGRGENRTNLSKDGLFEDSFRVWDVHLYRIRQANHD